MKLCFLGDIRSTHIQKFVKYFADKHETHLLSFDYNGDKRVDQGIKFFKNINTNIHFLEKNNLFISPFVARHKIKTIKPDLVQAHFVTNYGFLGAFSGVHPLVISAMGDDILIHPFQNKFYNLLIKYALHRADFITYDGINYNKFLFDELGIPKHKTAIIYPGIDMMLFHPTKRVASINPIVFYPRGFDAIYDTPTLLSAMEIIHEKCPDVRFTLLGVGTEFEKFRNNVLQSDLWKSVNYLGYISNEDLPEYYASADVSITTSLSDGGIPVSTIEAMACGTPVVSTDAGDALQWIRNEAGYVVPKQNPELIAKQVVDLLKNNDKRLEFGRKAREIVEKSYNYDVEMKKVENIYSKLLNNRIS